jgi:hypothetical protein
MGRPLKIKQSTTVDIGFNPYNLLDQPTVVIPSGLSSSQFTGVVGGAESGVATTAYPVIAITAFLTGGAEGNAYIRYLNSNPGSTTCSSGSSLVSASAVSASASQSANGQTCISNIGPAG